MASNKSTQELSGLTTPLSVKQSQIRQVRKEILIKNGLINNDFKSENMLPKMALQLRQGSLQRNRIH